MCTYNKYLDENPVSRGEFESFRTFNDQVGHTRRQKYPSADLRLAVADEWVEQPVDDLPGPDDGWAEQNLPEVRAVEDQENEVEEVEHMGDIEHL